MTVPAGGSELRPDAYRGGSRMAVPFPGDDTPEDPEAAPTHEADQGGDAAGGDDDGGDAVEHSGGSPAPRRRGGGLAGRLLPPQARIARRILTGGRAPGQGRAQSAGRAVANNGAGVIVAGMVWVWVVLPYIAGGPDGVKATLRAKFLNQAPDGSEL